MSKIRFVFAGKTLTRCWITVGTVHYSQHLVSVWCILGENADDAGGTAVGVLHVFKSSSRGGLYYLCQLLAGCDSVIVFSAITTMTQQQAFILLALCGALLCPCGPNETLLGEL